MLNERWKIVTDYPLYEVSNMGRVRNSRSGRIMALARHADSGWYYVGLSRNGKQTNIPVSRLVSDAFMREPLDPDTSILHRDGDRSNNAVNNLVWKPRWFAVMYMRQMQDPKYHRIKPFMSMKTKKVFDSIAHFASVTLVLPSAVEHALNGVDRLYFPRYGSIGYPDRILHYSREDRSI